MSDETRAPRLFHKVMLRPGGTTRIGIVAGSRLARAALTACSRRPPQAPQASAARNRSRDRVAHKPKAHPRKPAPVAEVPQAPARSAHARAAAAGSAAGHLSERTAHHRCPKTPRSRRCCAPCRRRPALPSTCRPAQEASASLPPLVRASPKMCLPALLNGSKFNYVILGEANNPGAVQKVILLARTNSTASMPQYTLRIMPVRRSRSRLLSHPRTNIRRTSRKRRTRTNCAWAARMSRAANS